jgi:hypothetical protein
LLEQWVAGNFKNDWPGVILTFTLKQNPTPDDLDIAATENCVGGPFYPGIEVSWLVRTKALFVEPFRFNFPSQPETPAQTDFAPLIVGALKFRPGFFSQQMALPLASRLLRLPQRGLERPRQQRIFLHVVDCPTARRCFSARRKQTATLDSILRSGWSKF